MVEGRVRLGDSFQLVSISSKVVKAAVRILVQFDDGRLREFPATNISNSDRTVTINRFGNMEADGVVVRASIATVTGDPQRGQTFYNLQIRDRNGINVGILIQDYLYGSHTPTFPSHVNPGPGGGNGFSKPRAVAEDIAPADITEPLAAINALRRIDGFIWYYEASGDVADRVLRVSLRSLGLGLPTNFPSGANTTAQDWPSAGGLTLSANQQGMMVVNHAGFAVTMDNGVPTHEDNTTQPTPFPYWADKADIGELFFDVASEEAADRHAIYILQEEWLD